MLEHGRRQDDSHEVFRDSIVGRFMGDLLSPFSASAKSLHTPPPLIHSADSIDVVAKRFLGSAVPFYQWYTDFVGLYDVISFAHPLFARRLLSPLSMCHPVDYRKYLSADYSHVMRTILTPPEIVVTGNIAEYLWLAEADAGVVGAYVRALVKGRLVACRVWPDLGSDGEERARKLLQVVVDQGRLESVQDVLRRRW